MDQYFERLNQAAENPLMPRRIQFMIQDLVDMRRNRWMPRKIGAGSEGPRTIQQIREDVYRDGGIYLPQQVKCLILNICHILLVPAGHKG